ncbi:MAG: hypothetical protein R3E18_00140 [Sphingomonadaceae bacterium]
MIWLQISAIVMVLTGIGHSTYAYRRFLLPLLTGPEPAPHLNAINKYSWHGVGFFMVLNGAMVAWPQTPSLIVTISGLFWIAMGIADLVIARGKHVAWVLLVAAGATSLIGTQT